MLRLPSSHQDLTCRTQNAVLLSTEDLMIRPRHSHPFLGVFLLGCLIAAGIVLLDGTKSDNPTETSLWESSSLANRVVSPRGARPTRPPVKPSGIETIAVRLQSKEKSALYTMTDPEAIGAVWGSQNSAPKSTYRATASDQEDRIDVDSRVSPEASASGVATPVTSFSGPDIDDDKTETGLRFSPPDPIAAAGPGHLVDVINVLVNFYQEDGTADLQDSLFDFFADLTPNTFTFDPKVVYDPYAGRFVIVTMDVTDFQPDGFDSSRILVAVSDDENPNGTWCVGDINAFSTFVGEADDQNALDHWAEYPGLAVDEEAVYITAEMRTFFSQTPPNEFGGVRLWIVDKTNDGLYDCVANPVDLAQVDVFDPFAGGGIVLTSQPAQIYGTPPSANVGNFLVSKGNLTNGTDEFAQVIRVDDPLRSPSFAITLVNLGDIEDLVGNETDPPLPNAPQSGSAELIDTNDRRALDAVWREDNLYFTATINPKPGDPDAGQATAFWARVDTNNLTGSPPAADQGVILGEEIGVATHTFYPSIAVDNTGAVAVGFSASGTTIFPSAYFTYRQAADGGGFTQPPSLVQAGQASYLRQFGTGRNRWGDYTGTAVHPLEAGCFWVFNQYAGEQDPQDTPPENGRWETWWAKFCVADSDIFADGFESGDTSAWSSVLP